MLTGSNVYQTLKKSKKTQDLFSMVMFKKLNNQ